MPQQPIYKDDWLNALSQNFNNFANTAIAIGQYNLGNRSQDNYDEMTRMNKIKQAHDIAMEDKKFDIENKRFNFVATQSINQANFNAKQNIDYEKKLATIEYENALKSWDPNKIKVTKDRVDEVAKREADFKDTSNDILKAFNILQETYGK